MSYWYLATPYSKYPQGEECAFHDAAVQAGFLLKNGIHIYCPIAHTHPIHTRLMNFEHSYEHYLALDKAIFLPCKGVIVCMLPSWKDSHGIGQEIGWAEELGKPVVYMEPFVLPEGIK